MSTRSAQSILDETQYWRLILDDLLALNERIGDIGRELSPAALHLAGAKIAVAFGADPDESVDRACVSVGSALDAVQAAQDPLFRLIDLSGGRRKALERELSGEDV